MARKRKANRRAPVAAGPRPLDPSEASLGHITSYKDIADSEDEYFMNQDVIAFDGEDDEPYPKRQRQDDVLELSDEEVLGYDTDDTDIDQDEEPNTKQRKGNTTSQDKGDNPEIEMDEGSDSGWWGTAKNDYYDADDIENEEDALEEETEAKRLQKKKYSDLAEEDFLFDEKQWAAPRARENGDSDARITEVLQGFEISANMTPEARYKLLQTHYPEFDFLVQEFNELQPLIEPLKREASGRVGTSVQAIRYWVLGCYVAALGSYFAILTSPARDHAGKGTVKALSPANLRDHEIMETLLRCRNAWTRVKGMKTVNTSVDNLVGQAGGETAIPTNEAIAQLKAHRRRDEQRVDSALIKTKAKLARTKAGEAAVADLYDLAQSVKRRASLRTTDAADALVDFGEEEALDVRTATEKAARKKSIRFYTSQIVQSSNRRQDAARDAGGDTDIPHRERFRDRQARSAAKHSHPAVSSINGKQEVEDDQASADNSDVDYYDAVASLSHKKRAAKDSRKIALSTASTADRILEIEEVGEDGKRKISYQIEKNKGLAPKRKKDVRNPRVKYRKKMDKQRKKHISINGLQKRTEGKFGYQGETTGINTRVIRSTKL